MIFPEFFSFWQLAIRIPTSPAQDSTQQYMQVDQSDKSLLVRSDMQNGGFPHAEYIFNFSKVSSYSFGFLFLLQSVASFNACLFLDYSCIVWIDNAQMWEHVLVA